MTYTIEGLEAAEGQNVSRADITAVLRSSQYLVEDVDSSTRAITARVLDGRLITVWLIENQDDEWLLETAFGAGFSTEIKWNHAKGGSDAGSGQGEN